MAHNEGLLCRTAAHIWEVIFTSERLVVLKLGLAKKLLGFGESRGGIIDGAFFAALRDHLGESKASKAVGESANISTAIDGLIDAGKTELTVSYGDISKTWLEKYSKGGVLVISTDKVKEGEAAFVFETDEQFRPVWKVVRSVMPEKLTFPSEEQRETFLHEMSRLKLISIDELCDYLQSIGFEAEVADFEERTPEKGLVKLKGKNIDYITKDIFAGGYSVVGGIIERVGSNVRGTKLKVKRKGGQVSELRWDGKDKQLVTALNQDQILMKQLSTGIENNEIHWLSSSDIKKSGSIWIGKKEMYKGQQFVEISSSIEYLPSKEYFQAIDILAGYICSNRE